MSPCEAKELHKVLNRMEDTLLYVREVVKKAESFSSPLVESLDKIEEGIVQIDVIEGFVDRVAIQGQVRGPRKLLNNYRRALLKSRP